MLTVPTLLHIDVPLPFRMVMSHRLCEEQFPWHQHYHYDQWLWTKIMPVLPWRGNTTMFMYFRLRRSIPHIHTKPTFLTKFHALNLRMEKRDYDRSKTDAASGKATKHAYCNNKCHHVLILLIDKYSQNLN